jgi:hypothetical protein
MSSYQEDRDQFVAALAQGSADPPHVIARIAAAIMRDAQGFHRLQVMQCNGDGYYWSGSDAHGTRQAYARYVTCLVCGDATPERAMVGSMKRPAEAPEENAEYRRKRWQCRDCQQRERIIQRLPEGWRVRFQGDPRGATVRICNAVDLPAGAIYSDSDERWYVDGKVYREQPRWIYVPVRNR